MFFRVLNIDLVLQTKTGLRDFCFLVYTGHFNTDEGDVTIEAAVDLAVLGDFFGSKLVVKTGLRIFTHIVGETYMRFDTTEPRNLLPMVRKTHNIAETWKVERLFNKVRYKLFRRGGVFFQQ